MLLLLGLLVAACDDTAAPVPTPIPQVPTPSDRSVSIGPALQTGEPMTFKAAYAKAVPAALKWNAGALLEVASVQGTPEIPAAGDWNFTYISPDGQQRVLVAVSSVEVQVQNLSGGISARMAEDIAKHAAQMDQVLDSPALIDKVKALNYSIADQDRIKIVYYTSGEDIAISARPNPVVQVRLSKGETGVQLNLDAVDGSLINKNDE
jgi:hypothetical protein